MHFFSAPRTAISTKGDVRERQNGRPPLNITFLFDPKDPQTSSQRHISFLLFDFKNPQNSFRRGGPCKQNYVPTPDWSRRGLDIPWKKIMVRQIPSTPASKIGPTVSSPLPPRTAMTFLLQVNMIAAKTSIRFCHEMVIHVRLRLFSFTRT